MEDKIAYIKECIEKYTTKESKDDIIFNKLLNFKYSKRCKLLNVTNISNDILLKALDKNPQLLSCIENQTYEMVKLSVERKGSCILFAKWDNLTDEQAEEIGIIACKQKGESASNALNNHKKLTRKLVVNAIIGWTDIWFNLSEVEYDLIDNQESMNEIVENVPLMYQYIEKKYKTKELTLLYIEKCNDCYINDIPKNHLNKDIILKLLNNEEYRNIIEEIIFEFITIEEYKNICIEKIKIDYTYIRYISKFDKELLLELVKINPKIIEYINPNKIDVDIAYEALKQDNSLVKFIKLKL